MKNITTKKYKNSQNKKEMVILRGAPSSGKSYLVNELAGESGQVFSADDYHMVDGEYQWKPENVSAAHQWNHNRIKEAILSGVSPVIADNTHTRKWELIKLRPLVELAKQQGYNVRIEEPNPNWYHWDTAFDVDALYERNKKTHNVPRATIQKMVDNYDRGITVEDILNDQSER